MKNDEILDLCSYYLKINFSGLNHEEIKKSSINQNKSINEFFEDYLKKKNNVFFPKKQFKIEEAIKDNINSIDSRYLLLISNSSVSSFMLEYILKKLKRNYSFFIGSQFENDKYNKDYSRKIINKIIPNIENGKFVIFKNLDVIYSSFYDLFNLHFHYLNEDKNKKFVRLGIGMINIPRLDVHRNFRCAILINEDEVNLQPSPLLSRFEKYLISFNMFLTLEEQKICKKIYDNFNSLFDFHSFNNKNEIMNINIKKQNINCGEEEIYALFYKLREEKDNPLKNFFSDNQKIINNVTDEIIKILTKNLSQDVIMYSKYSNVSNDFLNIIYNNYKLNEKKNKNLEQFIINMKTRKNIIYTFSSNLHSNKYVELNNKTIEVQFVSSFNSQFEIEERINKFYSSQKKILILRYDISQSHHLNHIASLIENQEKEKENYYNIENKTIIFIISLQRVFILNNDLDEKKHKNNLNKQDQIIEKNYISHLTEYEQIFIDNLEGENREISFFDLINSNEYLLRSINMEKNFEKLLKESINEIEIYNNSNKIIIQNNSSLYIYLKKKAEDYIKNLNQPVKAFISIKKNITGNTIDLYSSYIHFIKEQCKKYITFILNKLFVNDLINFLQNNQEENCFNVVDNFINEEEISNIKLNNLSSVVRKDTYYHIPFFNDEIDKLRKLINKKKFKQKFIVNEDNLTSQDEENYKKKKIKIIKDLIKEFNLNKIKNKDLFIEQSQINIYKKDFTIYYISTFYNKGITKSMETFISFIFDLVCESFKELEIEKTKDLDLLIYSCLWFESYNYSFLFKFLQNILNFSKEIKIEIIFIKEYIKELIESDEFKNKTKEKKLSHKISYLLNESFIYFINEKLKDKKIEIQTNCLEEIFTDCSYFKRKFNLFSVEFSKFEITKLIYECLEKNHEIIFESEKLQEKLYFQGNQDAKEELKEKLEEEVNELKNKSNYRINCKYNEFSFIINILVIKFNEFCDIDIQKKIIDIIFKDKNLLLFSKQVFNLIFKESSGNYYEDDYNIEDIILNDENQLLEYIEKKLNSMNSDLKNIFNVLFMDITSKFILKDFNLNYDSLELVKKYIKNIYKNEDQRENYKHLRYLIKIEYIKIFFFFISNNTLNNEIKKDFSDFINNNENMLNFEMKLYLIKCIKFSLNDSFSNLENYNGPINLVKNIIEKKKYNSLYLPLKMNYIFDKIKYTQIKIYFNNKDYKKNHHIKNKKDYFCLIQYFLFEKVSYILKNKGIENSNIFASFFNQLTENSKNLFNFILKEKDYNLSDETISLYILCFHIWCFLSEFFPHINLNLEIEMNDNLIESFIIIALKFVKDYMNEKKDLSKTQKLLEKQLNEINKKAIKIENINTSYCFIYSIIYNNYNQINNVNEEVNSIKDININLEKNFNYYNNFHFNYNEINELSNQNIKDKINEICIEHNNDFLFKEYYTYDEIKNLYIKNNQNLLSEIYFDERNQKIFKKMKILFEKIIPFLKILNKQYSGNIKKIDAKTQKLKDKLNKKLREKFELFEEGFQELFNENISANESLINFFFTENQFQLLDKFKQLIDEFNQIFPEQNSMEILNISRLSIQFIIENKFNLFDFTKEDIIPPLEKEELIQLNDFFDNTYRIIVNNVTFTYISKLCFDQDNILKIFKQMFSNYIWKLPYPEEFNFLLDFDDELYKRINHFEEIFKNPKPLKKKLEIKKFIENQNLNEESNSISSSLIENYNFDEKNNRINRFLYFLQLILKKWIKLNKTKFEENLIDEIKEIIDENEEENIIQKKIIKFINDSEFKTNQIILIYEYLENNFFEELIKGVPEENNKDLQKDRKKIVNFFKNKLENQEREDFQKILRKFILRFLIRESSSIANVELIQCLEDINKTNDKLKEILKKIKSQKLDLKVENAISLYEIIKKIKVKKPEN